MRLALAVLFAVALAAPLAHAQDVGEPSTYESISLRRGFTPDPYVVSVTAGGSTDVRVRGCNGIVSDAPDIDLTWSGRRTTLYIYSQSDGDTTLLVNMPNGSWRCDDDSLDGVNPVVVIRNAPAGVYNVWAGTFGDPSGALVMISEIDPR